MTCNVTGRSLADMSDAAPQHNRDDPANCPAASTRCEELESGGSVPGLSRPAFTLQRFGTRAVKSPLPVVIAVPHAGRAYPPDTFSALRHGEAAAHRLEDRFIDMVGRSAAAACGASLLVAHMPRALIDLNRDVGDIDSGMFAGPPPARQGDVPGMPRQQPRAGRGLGLFPRRLPGMGELWRDPLTAEEAERRIACVHRPYHAALQAELVRLRDTHGHAILIDLHSMPSLPGQGDEGGASHVVGDRFGASCASALSAATMDLLIGAYARPAYNRPYAGGYVLDRHGRPRRNIHALQLEVDRALYLTGAGAPSADGIAAQARIVTDLAHLLSAVLVGKDAGSSWGLADAAE